MSAPILLTKLNVPPPRPAAITRSRLVERLSDGLHSKLTLVSAPAGFGKTTLVSEWVANLDRPTAWLSLDEADSDLTRFLGYTIAALQTVATAVGDGMAGLLQLAQPPPAVSILTSLINDIGSLATPVVLVLDDYHLIRAPAIDDAVAFLLDHAPPQLHLVITTREDPRLPLARLRGRGEMTELRAADLRFTPDEATAFLNETMGLALTEDDVAALELRTEGWIAGLQLAALSMSGRDDISGFIRAFAGDDRYIVDYLADEVLRRQPEEIRDFLLQTSILDRLTDPLCDAVTGRNGSKALLGSLERGNLFVIPLDDKRRWYRYHHLFTDVLRAHLLDEHPDQVPILHRRASDWHEHNGFRPEAIQHALAAGDARRAAGLVELAALAMLGSSQEETLNGWLEALPDDLVRAMPVLSAYYGFASFGRAGGLDAAEARFQDAERWLDAPKDASEAEGGPSPDMIVVDEAAFRSLPGTLAVARAYQAGARGDIAGIVMHAREALDVLPETDDLWCGAASAVLGIGYWTSGNLEPAYRSFANGKARLKAAGYMQFQIVGVHILADIRVAQGRLREAERIYEEALQLAADQDDPAWGSADVYVGLSELLCERNDLAGAARLLLRSKELGEHAGLMDTRHRWYLAMARVKAAQEDLDSALQLFDEAERLYIPGADPDLHPISALKARAWVAQGRLAEALAWAHERNVSVDDDLSYLREFEHMTLARVLIARYQREQDEESILQGGTLLERLLGAAEAGERFGSVIQILVLQALACEGRGDIAGALERLGRALTLAEPEGYVRTFVDEGAPMRRLLAEAVRRGV